MPPARSNRPASQRPRTTRHRQKKTSTLTCRNCRTKKIRCDGSQPSCGICKAYSEDCLYDKAPPMSQILAMTERIAELERVVQGLRRQNPQTVVQDELPSPSLDEHLIHEPTPHVMTIAESSTLDSAEAFYESTSSVRAPETVLRQKQTPDIILACSSTDPVRLSQNHMETHFWEERLIELASIQLHLPPDTVRRLLATHWTWVHPTFMFVNRDAFLRDAVAGGEFCSPLLLSVLCLHSTRFTDRHLEDELLAKTKVFLSHEMHKEASLPLVQALLAFSAREIGRGNISQSWLYSGMAFRMAIDLGLFSTNWQDAASDSCFGSKLRSRVACQLAWSCFMWDKIISLYFGRTPMLSEPPKSEPVTDAVLDHEEMWQPNDGQTYYPETPSQKSSCWVNFCKLTVIINEILFSIYGSRRTKDLLAFVKATRQKLQSWRSQSPVAVRIDKGTSQEHSSPPHVLTQNMLYYTTMILLHRPFRGNASCRAVCRESAEGVEQLLLRMEQSFGLDKCTYAMAYSSYTAATVAVQDTKDGMPGATSRLDTYIRALRALRTSCPGIQRSIDIISQCLASNESSSPSEPDAMATQGQAESSGVGGREAVASLPFDQLPAFPLSSGHMSIPPHDPAGGAGFGHPASHPFWCLDSFPQEWIGSTDEGFDDFSFGFSIS